MDPYPILEKYGFRTSSKSVILNPHYTLESPNYVPAPLRLTKPKSLVGKQQCFLQDLQLFPM